MKSALCLIFIIACSSAERRAYDPPLEPTALRAAARLDSPEHSLMARS